MATDTLIIGPSWVGDMVMAHSLFKTVKARSPGQRIDVLAPGWSLGLLARMPEVGRAIAMPLGHGQFGLPTRLGLGRSLRPQRYQQAIVLPRAWKAALVPWFAGIPRRTGYVGEGRWGLLNDARALDKKRLPLTVQRFVALGLPPSAPLPPPCPSPQLSVDAGQRQAALARLGLAAGANILALCPGAEYGAAKRWPARHFAALAQAKLADGWQVWLFGSANDQPAAAAINQATGGQCADLTGRTLLPEAIDLLSLATAVVSNDSGLMHIAAALDKPLIALYGPSDPGANPPLADNAAVLSLNLACSPCLKRACPLGHGNCLQNLLPEQVLERLPP